MTECCINTLVSRTIIFTSPTLHLWCCSGKIRLACLVSLEILRRAHFWLLHMDSSDLDFVLHLNFVSSAADLFGHLHVVTDLRKDGGRCVTLAPG